MSWRMIGRPIATADMGTTNIYQTLTMPSTANYYLQGAVAGIVFYNNPALTNIAMRVYSDSSGPSALLATSDTYTKAEIITLDHGYKSIGFNFTNGISLAASGIYHFVLYATGYTGDDSSHIAWRHSYPDPQYRSGLTLNATTGDNMPFELSLVGSEI